MPIDTYDFPQPPSAGERAFIIRQRIISFVEVLRSIEETAVFATCIAEVQRLKNFYTLRTVRTALTEYRKAVREACGDQHSALKYLHSFDTDIKAYNAAYRQQVFEHHHSMRPVDPDFFIERALDELKARSYGRVVAGLILLTGRRQAEICFTGEFSLIADRDDVLLFSGQIKGRGTEKPPYEILSFSTHWTSLQRLELFAVA